MHRFYYLLMTLKSILTIRGEIYNIVKDNLIKYYLVAKIVRISKCVGVNVLWICVVIYSNSQIRMLVELFYSKYGYINTNEINEYQIL